MKRFEWMIVLLLAIGLSTAAIAQGAVKSSHGDWQVRCDIVEGGRASEQCAVMQNVTSESVANVGLTLILLKTADKKRYIMRVLTPLGVLIPSGLGLKIDNKDMGRAGFVRCLVSGCVAEVELDDQLLKELTQGKQAIFYFYQSPEEGIGIPLQLLHLDEAIKKLP